LLRLSFQSSGLGNGVYNATLGVGAANASNSPQTLTVRLTITDPPVMAVSPAALTFSAWGDVTNATQPAAQSVVISSASGGVISGLGVSISWGGGASGWLTASLRGNDTTTPAILDVRPTSTNLAANTYTATITITSTMTGVAPRVVNVSYTVQTFSVNLFPALAAAGCGNCHTVTAPPYSTAPLTYCGNLQFYARTPSATTASRLYQRVVANPGTAHTGGKYPQLGAALLAWITANAPCK
jgi:hypothetical protein